MAKTRQVLKVKDGAFQYECIRDLNTGAYKLYWLYGSWNDAGQYTRHKKLLGTANNMKAMLRFIANDIEWVEEHSDHMA